MRQTCPPKNRKKKLFFWGHVLCKDSVVSNMHKTWVLRLFGTLEKHALNRSWVKRLVGSITVTGKLYAVSSVEGKYETANASESGSVWKNISLKEDLPPTDYFNKFVILACFSNGPTLFLKEILKVRVECETKIKRYFTIDCFSYYKKYFGKTISSHTTKSILERLSFIKKKYLSGEEQESWITSGMNWNVT